LSNVALSVYQLISTYLYLLIDIQQLTNDEWFALLIGADTYFKTNLKYHIIHLHGTSPAKCRYIKTARASSSQQSRRRRPGRPARPMSTFERRPVIDGTH
jgi:hypothetical protein